MLDIQQKIRKQYEARIDHIQTPAIKINLYKYYEVIAVKEVIDEIQQFKIYNTPDCFMVGDSYLMTHLFQNSTSLNTDKEKNIFLHVLLESLFEVKSAIIKYFNQEQPYLIGDLPDGSLETPEILLRNAKLMLKYGADVVKLEIGLKDSLNNLDLLVKANIPVFAHIGFTPQNSENKRYGTTYNDAVELLKLARNIRNHGACGIILERVSEEVNKILSKYHPNGVPVYSIFSGKALYGGQNLNVWDSIYKQSHEKKYFPPTATFSIESYPQSYTVQNIKEHFKSLLLMTLSNEFPLSPKCTLNKNEIQLLEAIEIWR